MEPFKYWVSILSLVAFVLSIIVIIIIIKKRNKSPWPPLAAACPDYWTYNEATNECMNPTSGVSSNCQVLDVSAVTDYNSKCHYANMCNVGWDGITYGGKPCSGPNSSKWPNTTYTPKQPKQPKQPMRKSTKIVLVFFIILLSFIFITSIVLFYNKIDLKGVKKGSSITLPSVTLPTASTKSMTSSAFRTSSNSSHSSH